MAHLLTYTLTLIALQFGIATSSYAAELNSTRLTDAIDKGIGNVDLLKDLTSGALETYRSLHNGKLVLAVDINEAANGTEKSSSQGVAVLDAWLEVTFANGQTQEYGHAGKFWTETQTIVAPSGSTERAAYYSLLGETGSSRISSANSIQDAFDSTLKITVPDDLSTVTAAVVRIRLLDPNTKLGDPEAFYDFTAGFEDLAVLNTIDTAYLDKALIQESTFRTEAPVAMLSPEGEITAQSGGSALVQSSKLFFPSGQNYLMSAFEDLYPLRGDYDYNDVVVSFRSFASLNAQGEMISLTAEAYLVARGAVRTHDWQMTIQIPTLTSSDATTQCSTLTVAFVSLPCSATASAGQLVWKPFSDTRAIFPQDGGESGGMVNTATRQDFQKGPKAVVTVSFASPIAVPAGLAEVSSYQPSLFVHETSQTITNATKDESGWPFGVIFSSDWAWPLERIDTGAAYPDLVNFVASQGAQNTNWYTQPVTTKVHSAKRNTWVW